MTGSETGTLYCRSHPRTLTATMAGIAIEPPTHIVTCHIPDDGDYDSRDCEVRHLAALSRTCPDDDETAMTRSVPTTAIAVVLGPPTNAVPCCTHPRGRQHGLRRALRTSPGPTRTPTTLAPTEGLCTSALPVPVPRIPNDGDSDDTGCDGRPFRHLPWPRACSATTVTMLTQYPFALPTATTTRTAVKGTSPQFQLCALAQSSSVHTPYDDDDNDEGAGTATPLQRL
ncbi:hypothetical protein EDB83DRAFT_2324353 [Lactarius deliciosus]|nr:hypothetical protein EDB83DRAFT_2324353 [Lactarius deliciosus]